MTKNIDQLIEETTQSYYEYVIKLEDGCKSIISSLKSGDISTGIAGIQSLSEGLVWIVEIENLLQMHSLQISSPISTLVSFVEEINIALLNKNYTLLITLIEEKLVPEFKDAVNWKFEQVIN